MRAATAVRGMNGEAYATIVANDGWHACSAAVLGRILKRLDANRQRVVLVHKVSSSTRALLQRDGLWEAFTMDAPFRLPQSTLPWFGTLFALQAQLWSLPFRRVLYFDTDHVPLLSSPHRLLSLWKENASVPLAAPTEGTLEAGCFNSGMMLLHPGRKRLGKLRDAAEYLERKESRPELLALRRRCPYGWNLDQPLINYVFPRGAWEALKTDTHGRATPWRMVTSFNLLHGARPTELCNTRRLPDVADSMHYMAPFRPWLRSEEHTSCILFGSNCLTREDVERFALATHFANYSVFWPWLNCTFWASAAATWWSEFVRLDQRTRQVCRRWMQ